MRKDRTYCTSYKCMIRTCGRHRCHLPKWYKHSIVWVSFHEEGCPMYISKEGWKTIDFEEDVV